MKRWLLVIIVLLLFVPLAGFTGGEFSAIQALLEKGGFVPSFLAVVWGTLLLLKRYPPTLNLQFSFDPETKEVSLKMFGLFNDFYKMLLQKAKEDGVFDFLGDAKQPNTPPDDTKQVNTGAKQVNGASYTQPPENPTA